MQSAGRLIDLKEIEGKIRLVNLSSTHQTVDSVFGFNSQSIPGSALLSWALTHICAMMPLRPFKSTRPSGAIILQ